MKKVKFRKRNLIALSLVAAVAFSTCFVYRVNAAKAVDISAKTTVTVNIASATDTDTSSSVSLADDYTGDIEVTLYKLADTDATGNISKNATGFEDLDLSKITSTTTASEMKEIVDAAEKIIAGTSSESDASTEVATDSNSSFVIVSGSLKNTSTDAVFSTTIDLTNNQGLYLIKTASVNGKRYTWDFSSYLIFAPTNYYGVSDANGAVDTSSDAWVYDITTNLKPSITRRYGSITIDKNYTAVDTTFSDVSSVFEVQAYLDATFNEDGSVAGTLVYDNVVAFNGDLVATEVKDDEGNVTSVTYSVDWDEDPVISDIPSDTYVVVTEVYSGASYTAKTTTATVNNLAADTSKTVSFENEYNNKLVSGTLGVTNTFEYTKPTVDESGTIKEGSTGSYTYTGPNVSSDNSGNDTNQ